MKTQDNSYLTLRDLWEYFVVNIWLFAASITLCVACSVVYIAKTSPSYTRTVSILIKEDTAGQSIRGSVFESMGLVQSKTNINNEIHVLANPSLMAEVVERLSLNYNYSLKYKGVRWVDLYKDAPFVVETDEAMQDSSISFLFKTDGVESFTLSDLYVNGQKIESINGTYNHPITLAGGSMTIKKGVRNNKSIDGNTYSFSKGDVGDIARAYAAILSVKLRSEDASIVHISLTMGSIKKADDILNTLIEVYNENWIKDKNLITFSTNQFINERLEKIGSELGEVDQSISNYKSDHLLPDIGAVAGINLQSSNENLKLQISLNNQLYMAEYILDYIKSNSTADKLLPTNAGIESGAITSQIDAYNELLLRKNSLIANSSVNNPIVSDMVHDLASLREVLIMTVEEHITTLSMRIASAEKEEKSNQEKISSNPEQELFLLSTGREQKIKEELYLYLLQKREENELNQAFTAYNTKVLDYASGSKAPVAPQKKVILLFGFAIGCLLPILFLIIKSALQTTVSKKDDLNGLSIPFLGLIPAMDKKKLKRKEQQGNEVMISLNGSRDGINESFRVVRTNLDFILTQDNKCKTTLVTSFNPKSGKSFIAINLALSMASKDSRVLVVDCDFRRGTLSQAVERPKEGLVNYLNRGDINIESVIRKGTFHPMLDVLPMGTVPPNPTELLLKQRFADLVGELQQKYEYIFFDCPPVEIVPDATIVEKYCDASIFVVRAGLMDKRQLPDLEELYNSKRLKNMSLILNGVDLRSGYGYGRYGYGRYGYGKYGYGYGNDK